MANRPQSFWATLWVAEGGSPSKADLASAVVMAESGGDEKSNSNPCCKGGYQINVEVGNTSLNCAMNAVCSTRWAIKNSHNGRDWSQWEAYTNGSYEKYLGGSGRHPRNRKAAKQQLASFHLGPLPEGPAAEKVIEGIGGVGGDLLKGTNTSNPLEALKGVQELGAFFVGFGELVLTPEGWLRLAKLIGGAILALWGLRILIRESTGSDPVHTATKVAETAAAVATVK